eukprot:3104821-Amphidinium_carterae.1
MLRSRRESLAIAMMRSTRYTKRLRVASKISKMAQKYTLQCKPMHTSEGVAADGSRLAHLFLKALLHKRRSSLSDPKQLSLGKKEST